MKTRKLNFKTIDLDKVFTNASKKENMAFFYLHMKKIYNDARVVSDREYTNALFSVCDNPEDLFLGLVFYNDLVTGHDTEFTKAMNRIEEIINQNNIPFNFSLVFNRNNKFGWVDEDSFLPDLDEHKAKSVEMILKIGRSEDGVSLVRALQGLQQMGETHCNWESAAMLAIGWDAIARQLEGNQCNCEKCVRRRELEERASELLMN